MIARATLVLLAPILVTLGASATPTLAQSPSDAPDGHRLFVQSCAVCHLKPSPTAKTCGPELTQDLVKGHEDAIAQIIRDGSQRMPGFKYDLRSAEIDAIRVGVTHIDSEARVGIKSFMDQITWYKIARDGEARCRWRGDHRHALRCAVAEK